MKTSMQRALLRLAIFHFLPVFHTAINGLQIVGLSVTPVLKAMFYASVVIVLLSLSFSFVVGRFLSGGGENKPNGKADLAAIVGHAGKMLLYFTISTVTFFIYLLEMAALSNLKSVVVYVLLIVVFNLIFYALPVLFYYSHAEYVSHAITHATLDSATIDEHVESSNRPFRYVAKDFIISLINAVLFYYTKLRLFNDTAP